MSQQNHPVHEGHGRRAGLLIHPTSLPGPFGIGDVGPATVRFLDWMSEAGLSVWQVLPLGPTGAGASPYSALSAFAGNPMLISIRALEQARWLSRSRGFARAHPTDRVDFARVAPWKQRRLREAWRRFRRDADTDARLEFEAFVEHEDQAGWLEDWALFAAVRKKLHGQAWSDWPLGVRLREAEALRAARRDLEGSIAFERFLQFLFFRQWEHLRCEAHARGIELFGDVPYYVAGDSADVWAHRELFRLDERGLPLAVAGVPPDYFSATGQRWGNPLFDWEKIEEREFAWWIDRIRANLRLVDRLRLDHFRGFAAYWEVDAREETAMHGRWVPGPGRRLFEAVRAKLGDVPLVAEDLGLITEDVTALRDELGLPGMLILQFAFGDEQSDYLPERHRRNAIVYTGTHDNDTTRGWFQALPPEERRKVLDYLQTDQTHVVRRLVETAFASPADLAVVPMQDVLDLGSAARMNRPGVGRGNWCWRAPASALSLARAERLRELVRRTHRSP